MQMAKTSKRLILAIVSTILILKTFAEIFEEDFEEVEHFFGQVASQLGARTALDCSSRCGSDSRCQAYQYKAYGRENCFFLQFSTPEESITFQYNHLEPLFKKIIVADDWTAPVSWTSGNFPVFYRSFDSDRYIQLRNGAQIVSGKLNNAVMTNLTNQEWVTLGDLSNVACLTIPNSCGSAGAALSLWIRILDCPRYSGIITTQYRIREGFCILCNNDQMRYGIILPEIEIWTGIPIPSGWCHLVFNYKDPIDELVIYRDGVRSSGDIVDNRRSFDAGIGVVAIGRLYGYSNKYSSVLIDELLFFNRKLTLNEVQILSNLSV